MPAIDLSILNQRQTPAFYADVFANRPAAGFVGRIFVSTNTFAFYRDNGTGWDLIGGPGTGTITGSGASGQIALWDGASTITGDTGLTYNGTDNSLTASKFIVTGGTSSQFLKADGSVDSSSYVPYTGATTSLNMGANNISGQNYFINGNGVNNGGYLAIKQYSGTSSGSQGYTSLYAALQNSLYINYSQTNGSIKTAELSSALLGTTPRQFQFPDADGTFALTSNIPSVSGAASQVAFFSGANAITGENNLWWDSTNNHLGINTNTPATALDVNHNGTLVAKFNNTTSANSLIAFENAGNEQWWIGTENTNNDFLFYDATNFPTLSLRTTFKTNGQVLIGGGSTGSGKLVVESATGDNGIQIVGATAPSLRIDSAASGPTKRAGLGISTATNNFIQGSADRDFCIFNGSTTASPMLFGIYDAGAVNVQEAARISAARNFLIGTTTDAGFKLDVYGQARIYQPSTNSANYLNIFNNRTRNAAVLTETTNGGFYAGTSIGTDTFCYQIYDGNAGISRLTISSAGNVGIGITPNTWTGTNVKAIQFGNSGALGNSQTFGTILFNNSYYDGGYRYITSNPASAYVQDGSTHIWYSANAGTGGAGITFVNTMNLSSTGGSQARLNLLYNFYIDNDQSPEIVSYVATSGSSIQRWLQGTSPTETMRLSTSKNLLIGTTTDVGAKLQVNGNFIALGNAGSNGILSRETITSTAFGFFNSGIGTLVLTNSGVANVGSFDMTTGVYTPTSDRNKKKNFEQSNLGLEAILKLKPTLYNMISQSDHEAKELGFIAQEVKEVIEQAYVQNGEFIGLNYQPIVAALVKAIQDLNNKIENLKN